MQTKNLLRSIKGLDKLAKNLSVCVVNDCTSETPWVLKFKTSQIQELGNSFVLTRQVSKYNVLYNKGLSDWVFFYLQHFRRCTCPKIIRQQFNFDGYLAVLIRISKAQMFTLLKGYNKPLPCWFCFQKSWYCKTVNDSSFVLKNHKKFLTLSWIWWKIKLTWWYQLTGVLIWYK